MQSFLYSFQYSYITITFPSHLQGTLLAVCILVQGITGFVAWPVLSPNPFGAAHYETPLLIVTIPSVIFYTFCYIQRGNDAFRNNFLNCILEFQNVSYFPQLFNTFFH